MVSRKVIASSRSDELLGAQHLQQVLLLQRWARSLCSTARAGCWRRAKCLREPRSRTRVLASREVSGAIEVSSTRIPKRRTGAQRRWTTRASTSASSLGARAAPRQRATNPLVDHLCRPAGHVLGLHHG